MLNIRRMPTHQELVSLSNSDLSKYTKAAKAQFEQARQRGEDTATKRLIYQAFERERLKRLDLIKNGAK